MPDTLTNTAEPTGGASDAAPLPMHLWLRIGVLAALFIYYFHYVLAYLGRLALDDPNWSHAFLVPFISLYFLYLRHERWAVIPPRVSWWGLPLFIAGMVGYALGIYPITNHMAMAYSMIAALFGLVWLLNGRERMRELWLPILYLVFGVKISYALWEPVAWQLQRLAASCAGPLITICGLPLAIEAEVTGTAIHILHNGLRVEPPVNIAEACSGLRMLMTLVALGVAYVYVSERAWWNRALLVLLTVPIAILVNAGRVTVIGLIYPYNQQLGTGDFHLFIGLFMLVPALGLLTLASWFLDKLVIPAEHDTPQIRSNR